MRGDRLETERLVLRRWAPADRAPFAAINADPEVMAHFPGLLTVPQSDELVERIEAMFGARGFGLWALEVKAGGGLAAGFIGCTGLAPLRAELPHAGQIEVGWRLARTAWGHGFATEAARASLAYGFEVVGLDEIVSITAVVNDRSRAVMERLGMTRDPGDDFEHPVVPKGHPSRPHVLYRLRPDGHDGVQVGV